MRFAVRRIVDICRGEWQHVSRRKHRALRIEPRLDGLRIARLARLCFGSLGRAFGPRLFLSLSRRPGFNLSRSRASASKPPVSASSASRALRAFSAAF